MTLFIFLTKFAIETAVNRNMSRTIKIKRGLDIPLEGPASGRIEEIKARKTGMVPDDFQGFVWKCDVKEGDEVTVGSPLLHDKLTGRLKVVSPIDGKVEKIVRGERRKIMAVVVAATKVSAEKISYDLSRHPEAIRKTLHESGLWVMMRQRPFDVIPDPDSEPRDVFVTGFDSSPLAPVLFNKQDIPQIETGLEILEILTGKTPYIATGSKFTYEFKHAENLKVDGPHPAGNVGVQIGKIKPVNKGETVWALNVETVMRIGRLYNGESNLWNTLVAITGPAAKDPHMVETTIGVSLEEILKGAYDKEENVRVISGNVLTGKKENPETGFLRYPYYQITLLPEGNDADEFMGWASLSPKKFSVKRTFPAFLKGLNKPFPFDARIKGGRRAMILSGEYDKVFPFDIYPEYLIRSMLSGDIDRMEKLGIYEVAPEDFALPEFVDTSKMELQKLVRENLDRVRSEE